MDTRGTTTVMRGTIRAISVLVFGMIALATVSALAAPAFADAVQRCGQPPTSDPSGAPVLAQLGIENGESTTLPFGRNRTEQMLEVALSVTGCEYPSSPQTLQAEIRQFRRGGAFIPTDQVKVSAIGQRDQVLVRVTIDPKNADPGDYAAKVSVNDPSVADFQFQVDTTLQYPGVLALIGLSVGALLIGVGVVWASGAFSFAGPWHKTAAHMIAAIGGAVTAFSATYWQNPTWGSDSWQVVLLGFAVGAATVAAMTTTSAITRGADQPAASKVAPDAGPAERIPPQDAPIGPASPGPVNLSEAEKDGDQTLAGPSRTK